MEVWKQSPWWEAREAKSRESWMLCIPYSQFCLHVMQNSQSAHRSSCQISARGQGLPESFPTWALEEPPPLQRHFWYSLNQGNVHGGNDFVLLWNQNVHQNTALCCFVSAGPDCVTTPHIVITSHCFDHCIMTAMVQQLWALYLLLISLLIAGELNFTAFCNISCMYTWSKNICIHLVHDFCVLCI